MEKMNPVVAALRDDIRRRQQVVQHIASLEEQLDSDRICGAWLAAQGTLTASLRRIGTATYRMLVYDHTLCYRRLVQDASSRCDATVCSSVRRRTAAPTAWSTTLRPTGSRWDATACSCPTTLRIPPPKSSKHPSNSYGKTSGTPSGVAAPRHRGSPRPMGRLRPLEPRTGYRQLHQ